MRAMAEIYESKLWNEADLYPFNTYAPRLMSGSRTVQGCGAPYGNTPVIDVDGDVYPCIYIVGIEKFYMGNIMDGTFPDMWSCSRSTTISTSTTPTAANRAHGAMPAAAPAPWAG